jgi:hypothetical protein
VYNAVRCSDCDYNMLYLSVMSCLLLLNYSCTVPGDFHHVHVPVGPDMANIVVQMRWLAKQVGAHFHSIAVHYAQMAILGNRSLARH